MHVHESRHDEAARDVDPDLVVGKIPRPGYEVDDAAALDDKGAAVVETIGQDERGAGEEDAPVHGTGLGASRCFRPRSGISAASGARMTSRSKSRSSRRMPS